MLRVGGPQQINPLNRFPRIGKTNQDDCCERPEGLIVEDPSNPASWYKGNTQLYGDSQNWISCIQNKLIEGLSGNTNTNQHALGYFLFLASALSGASYDLFQEIVERRKQDQKANSDTISLASAVKSVKNSG